MKNRKRKQDLNGRKGNAIIDVIFIIIAIFGFSLASIIGYKIFTDINDEIQVEATFSNDSKEILDDLHGKYPPLFDGAFLVILIFLWIGGIIASFMVDSHPIFLVATIVLTVFVLFLGAIFSNSYEGISQSSDLSNYSSEFPITNFMMGNLYIIVLIMSISISLVLFGKFRSGGGI